MWGDVVDLRDFYGSRLGQVARRLISSRIRSVWPDLTGLELVGIGYATPYLRQFRGEAQRVLAVMPAQQGVLPWPPDGPNLTVLADETDLPLADASVDRVLMVHAIECSEELRGLLREAWRVLNAGGRLLAVVPNRRGIWARTDRTPFGNGHPYSPTQLSRLLRECLFTPIQNARALYVPPVASNALLGSALAVERLGERWFQRFSGVVMIEATKQIYAATATRRPLRRRRPVIVPLPQAAGVPLAGRAHRLADGPVIPDGAETFPAHRKDWPT